VLPQCRSEQTTRIDGFLSAFFLGMRLVWGRRSGLKGASYLRKTFPVHRERSGTVRGIDPESIGDAML
jgi:hypothetical protein